MLKVLSLFSGIGAFECALKRNNIEYEIINYCEIDKYASKCYSNMHRIPEIYNLGDITKINIDKLPHDIDLLIQGSPCQDFSISGKGLGGDENSGTRSSLLWYAVHIISKTMPKYVVWENVKNVLSPKHKHNFEKYLTVLEKLGYSNQYKIFNSKDFDLPQNRERIFVVSIRKDIKNNFNINNIKTNKTLKPLKDILLNENEIEEKYFVKRPLKKIKTIKNDIITIGEVSSKGSQAGKVYDENGIFPTICACTHGYAIGYVHQNEKVRMLTPLEVFLAMGFTKEEFDKCKELNISDTQLYKMAGNSIAIPIIEKLFKHLLC